MNTSGIKPIEFNVLVKQDAVQEKTEGGLFLAEESKDRERHAETRGVLVAVSPMAFTYDDWPEGEEPPKPGAKVIFARHAGTFVEGVDGEEYRVLKDKDVVGVIE